MQAKRGFTLVEILIVVVILGILAAIVIPQFTQASTEAKQNSLCSDLQTLRSQIELYKVQHNDVAPTFANFASQMIYCSTAAGVTNTSKQRDTTYILGPYLERVPENPFTNTAALRSITDPNDAGSGGTTTGWAYVEGTGEIRADDTVPHAAF
jgi:general secretion pathway protein G